MQSSDTGLRILLADDHEGYRAVVRSWLEDEPDFVVEGEAVDGIEAVRLAGVLEPDVVVMDVVMPKLTGVAATRKIVSAHPAVRVIGLSLHMEPELVGRMIEAGATGYLLKEDDPARIVEGIRAVGAGRQYFSPSLRRLETAR